MLMYLDLLLVILTLQQTCSFWCVWERL